MNAPAILTADGTEVSLPTATSPSAPSGAVFTARDAVALGGGGSAVLSQWISSSTQGLVLDLYDAGGVLVANEDVAGAQAISAENLIALAGGGVALAWTGEAVSGQQTSYAVYGALGAKLGSGTAAAPITDLTGYALPHGGFEFGGHVYSADGLLTTRTAPAGVTAYVSMSSGAYVELKDNEILYFDGTGFAPVQTLPGEADRAVSSAALTELKDGSVAMIWTDGSGAYEAVYDPVSHALSPATRIDGFGAADAHIVALGDGGFAASWTDGAHQIGEAFGANGEVGPSLYIDGQVVGITASGDLTTLSLASGVATEQHYGLSYAAPATPGPVYLDALGQVMPTSAGNWDDVTHSIHGPADGGAVIFAPVSGPAGVATNGGNNTIVAANGDETFYLGAGDTVDVPTGVTGTKTIWAWNSEVLPQGVQNLTFFGAGNYAIGNDLNNLIVMGGNDSNYMDGGAGNDVLVGGLGKNTFGVEAGNGSDAIYNFHTWQDAVRLTGTDLDTFAEVRAAMTQVGGDVVLQIDPAETLTFRGVTLSDFTAQNFLLPLDTSLLGALTFDDEFNSLQLLNTADGAGHWRTNFGATPNTLSDYQISANQEKQVYTDPSFQGTTGAPMGLDPFTDQNGVLTITAQALNSTQSQEAFGQAYSSGMLNTKGLFEQQYGYFEMKAELPTALGTWPAFWLAQDPFVPGTEADILEHLALQPNVAYSRVNDNGYVTGNTYYMADPGGYHTYGMLWTPTETAFYVDGVAVMEVPTPASWDQPMYMILNMALGGWGGTIDNSALPAQMNVDYVRVYSLADGSSIVDDMTSANGYVSIASANYAAPTGVTTINLVGSGQTVVGNNAGDTFISDNIANVLVGGTGDDTFHLGRAGDTATGGGGADTFVYSEVPWAGGQITDFTNQDKLDLSAMLGGFGYTGSNAIADGVLKIGTDGHGDTQVWVNSTPGASSPTWWLVTTLDGVDPSLLQVHGGVIAEAPPVNPVVSTAAPVYTAPAGVSDITLTGSAQTVTGNNAGDTFHSNNTGNHLIGGAGADVFDIGRAGDVVTGGGGADVFAFAETPWAGATLTDFNTASDRVDVSGLLAKSHYAGTDPIHDGYLKIMSDGHGDAQIWSDLDFVSSGAGWYLVATLEGVDASALSYGGGVISAGLGPVQNQPAGAQAAPVAASTASASYVAPAGVTDITLTGSAQTVTGNNAGDVFHSNDSGNHLIGGTGADTFHLGRGGDIVTGGGGSDVFAFAETPWAGGQITDFSTSLDKIDLSGLLAQSGYAGTNAIADGYLKISDSASGAQLWSNLSPLSPGAGWWLVTTVDGVSASALHLHGAFVTG